MIATKPPVKDPKEASLPFIDPLILAILADVKTQTRRTLKVQPDAGYVYDHFSADGYAVFTHPAADKPPVRVKCPYGAIGSEVWVREAHALENLAEAQRVVYRADRQAAWVEKMDEKFYLPTAYRPEKWRPAMFMFKHTSRIRLRIKSVRAERLGDISEADAKAEGVATYTLIWTPKDNLAATPLAEYRQQVDSYRDSFLMLWDLINGLASVVANPWVFVITFERVEL